MKLDPNDPKPGIYPDVPMFDYLQINAVGSGQLAAWNESVPDCIAREQMKADIRTLAFDFGTAAHLSLLEPQAFADSYVIEPQLDGPKNRNPWKQEWDAWKEANADAIESGRTLTPDDYVACMAIRETARRQPQLAEFLDDGDERPQAEVTYIWQDRETGLMCKARADLLGGFYGFRLIGELKSAADASYSAFSKAALNYNYHIKHAWYVDGLQLLDADQTMRFWFVVFDKRKPYPVAVYELETEAVLLGRKEYRKRLDRYAACLKSGVWGGYEDGPTPLSLPVWAATETLELTLDGERLS